MTWLRFKKCMKFTPLKILKEEFPLNKMVFEYSTDRESIFFLSFSIDLNMLPTMYHCLKSIAEFTVRKNFLNIS
jgi:hypothetical protein